MGLYNLILKNLKMSFSGLNEIIRVMLIMCMEKLLEQIHTLHCKCNINKLYIGPKIKKKKLN